MTQDIANMPVAFGNDATNVVAISPAVAEIRDRAHSGVVDTMDWKKLVELETWLAGAWWRLIMWFVNGESVDVSVYSQIIVAKTKYREHLIAEQNLPATANDNVPLSQAA